MRTITLSAEFSMIYVGGGASLKLCMLGVGGVSRAGRFLGRVH